MQKFLTTRIRASLVFDESGSRVWLHFLNVCWREISGWIAQIRAENVQVEQNA